MTEHRAYTSVTGEEYREDEVLQKKMRVPLEQLCAEKGVGEDASAEIQEYAFAMRCRDAPTAVVAPGTFVCIMKQQPVASTETVAWVLRLLLAHPYTYVPNSAVVACMEPAAVRGCLDSEVGTAGECGVDAILDSMKRNAGCREAGIRRQAAGEGSSRKERERATEREVRADEIADALMRGYAETGGDRRYVPSEIHEMRHDTGLRDMVIRRLEILGYVILGKHVVTAEESEQMMQWMRVHAGAQIPVREILREYMRPKDVAEVQRSAVKRRRRQVTACIDGILHEQYGVIAAHGGVQQLLSVMSAHFASRQCMARELQYLGVDPVRYYEEHAARSRADKKRQPALRSVQRGTAESADGASSSELEEGEVR